MQEDIVILMQFQLRQLGIELHDDAGNRIRPGSPEEIRVVRALARKLETFINQQRQTSVGESVR